MQADIDATTQTFRVLSRLARLRHRSEARDEHELDDLRPAWMSLDAWDGLLEDLAFERYREHTSDAPRLPADRRLRLVR